MYANVGILHIWWKQGAEKKDEVIYVWIWKWWLQPRNPILPCRYIFPYTHRKTKRSSVFLIVWTAINDWHYISLYHYNAFACILQEGWLTFLLKKYSLLNIHTWFDRGVLSAWSQVRCHIGLKTTAYDSHHFHPHEAFLWLPTPTPLLDHCRSGRIHSQRHWNVSSWIKTQVCIHLPWSILWVDPDKFP